MQGRRLAVEFSLGQAFQTMRVSFSRSPVRGAAPVAELVFAIGTGGSAKLEGKEHCAILLRQQQQLRERYTPGSRLWLSEPCRVSPMRNKLVVAGNLMLCRLGNVGGFGG